MNRTTRNLTAAAAALRVRLRPEFVPDGQNVSLPAEDVAALVREARNAPHSVDVRLILNLLDVRGPQREPVILTDMDASRLVRALEQLNIALDRARRVDSGTFHGPMSGSEAVRYARAQMRRGH